MVKRTETIDAVLTDVATLIARMRSEGTNQSAWLALDLTMAQMKALMIVVGERGARRATSRTIAAQLHVGPSAVTPLVDKLVAAKLVKREPDPSDRRVTFLVPTAKAIALHEKLHAAGRAFWVSLLDELSDDDIEAARRTFASLAAAVRKRQQEIR
jgi:DNA-binding MarR family transcriptional regulator